MRVNNACAGALLLCAVLVVAVVMTVYLDARMRREADVVGRRLVEARADIGDAHDRQAVEAGHRRQQLVDRREGCQRHPVTMPRSTVRA